MAIVITESRDTAGRPWGALILAPLAMMKRVAAQPERFAYVETEQSAFTFAKLYYRGFGQWWLAGYDYNRLDVIRVLNRLRELAEQEGIEVLTTTRPTMRRAVARTVSAAS
jgi:hypothetical protein